MGKPRRDGGKAGCMRLMKIALVLAVAGVLSFKFVSLPEEQISIKQCNGEGFLSAADTSALAKLTAWRSSLFLRVMNLQRETEKLQSPEVRAKERHHLRVQPEKHRRFDLFSPFLDCPGGKTVGRYGGDGDGGKLICGDMLNKDTCVVYSLGSNDNYKFEEDIFARTPCKVVTFDCTRQGKTLNDRHTYVRKCLGNEQKMKENPTEWVTLEKAMKDLGHSGISLLKIDIEGSEYDVFSTWGIADHGLPEQISIEIHYNHIYYGTPSHMNTDDFSNLIWPPHQVTLSEMALFVGHLANMGYGIVSREDNPTCSHCTELTLRRVQLPCSLM